VDNGLPTLTIPTKELRISAILNPIAAKLSKDSNIVFALLFIKGEI
jgi:hypothetical protein